MRERENAHGILLTLLCACFMPACSLGLKGNGLASKLHPGKCPLWEGLRLERQECLVYDSLEDRMGESFGSQHGLGSGPVRRRSKEVQLARDIFARQLWLNILAKRSWTLLCLC